MPLQFCQEGAYVNAAMAQGESVADAIKFQNPDGTIMNITGFTMQFTVQFPVPLYLNTNNGGITIPDGTTGIAYINIADTSSINFQTGVFPYEFFATDSGGNRKRDWSGSFTVNPSFTPII